MRVGGMCRPRVLFGEFGFTHRVEARTVAGSRGGGVVTSVVVLSRAELSVGGWLFEVRVEVRLGVSVEVTAERFDMPFPQTLLLGNGSALYAGPLRDNLAVSVFNSHNVASNLGRTA
jgi:hypothetical protein